MGACDLLVLLCKAQIQFAGNSAEEAPEFSFFFFASALSSSVGKGSTARSVFSLKLCDSKNVSSLIKARVPCF